MGGRGLWRLEQHLRGLEQHRGNRGRNRRGLRWAVYSRVAARRAITSMSGAVVVISSVVGQLAVEHMGNLQSGFRARQR